MVSKTYETLSGAFANVASVLIGFIITLYILPSKETLKVQVKRLMQANRLKSSSAERLPSSIWSRRPIRSL